MSFIRNVRLLTAVLLLSLVGCASVQPGSFNVNNLLTPEARAAKQKDNDQRITAMQWAQKEKRRLLNAGDVVRFDFPNNGKAFSLQWIGLPAMPGQEVPGVVSLSEYSTSGDFGSEATFSLKLLAKRDKDGNVVLVKDKKGNYQFIDKGKHVQDTAARSFVDRILPAVLSGTGVQLLKMADDNCDNCGGNTTLNVRGGAAVSNAVNRNASAVEATVGGCRSGGCW